MIIILSAVLPFIFCITLSACFIWINRNSLTPEKITGGSLSLFFLETLSSLILSTELVSSVEYLLTILCGLTIVLLASGLTFKETLHTLSILTCCRLVTMYCCTSRFMQILICYGGILGADLFISYFEEASEFEQSPKPIYLSSPSHRHSKLDSHNSEQEDSNSLSNFSNVLNSSSSRRISVSLLQRRFSGLTSILSKQPNPTVSITDVQNSSSSNQSEVADQFNSDSTKVKLLQKKISGSGAVGSTYDCTTLLTEADGLLAELLANCTSSPNTNASTSSVIKATRKLIQQASVQTQQSSLLPSHHNLMASHKSTWDSKRRKSTIGMCYNRHHDNDTVTSSDFNFNLLNLLGNNESNNELAILRSGSALSARRLSATTLWTTTTSATGMPTMVGETEPTTKKMRSIDRRASLSRSSYLAANASNVNITIDAAKDTDGGDVGDCKTAPLSESSLSPFAIPSTNEGASTSSKNSRTINKSISELGGANDCSYSLMTSNKDQLPLFQTAVPEEDVFALLENVGISKDIMTGELIAKLNMWNFPIFDLENLLPDRILTGTAFKVFDDCSLLEYFNIDIKKFINFFSKLEDGYWKTNSYHTRTHAADVMQGVYFLTSNQVPCSGSRHNHINTATTKAENEDSREWSYPSSINELAECSVGAICDRIPEMEHLSLLLAAAMHDYDHPGRTNAFLVHTSDPLAILYNDRSVLENHHAASSWALLMKEENDFISAVLDPIEFRRLRFLVLETILATDLKKHFDFLAQMTAKLTETSQLGGPVFDWTNEADRILYCQLAIKLADIGGPSKSFEIHNKWTEHICEEFYQQGDDEVRRGLPVSAYMSRSEPKVAELQDSFITHMVGPLCEVFEAASLFPLDQTDETESKNKVSNELEELEGARTLPAQNDDENPELLHRCISSSPKNPNRTQSGCSSHSTKYCIHKAMSKSELSTDKNWSETNSEKTRPSLIMKQVNSNLLYWQKVLEQERQGKCNDEDRDDEDSDNEEDREENISQTVIANGPSRPSGSNGYKMSPLVANEETEHIESSPNKNANENSTEFSAKEASVLDSNYSTGLVSDTDSENGCRRAKRNSKEHCVTFSYNQVVEK